MTQTATNLHKNLQKLTPATIDNFGYKIKFCLSYEIVQPSQQTVAQELGYCRETINRADKVLHDLGYVRKERQGHWEEKKTNRYYLNPMFKDKKLLREIAHHFKWSLVGIIYLFSVVQAGSLNVTHNKSYPTKSTYNVAVCDKKPLQRGTRQSGRTWFDDFYMQKFFPHLYRPSKGPINKPQLRPFSFQITF